MPQSILTLACMFLCGCATRTPHLRMPPPSPEGVRLPAQTPYDDDPGMRAVYLNYYWYGYHDGMRGITGSFCGSGHPYYDVQRAGLLAGQRDGIAVFFASKRRN